MIGALVTLIHDEIQRIWCYRWLVLGTTLVLLAAATVLVMRMPNYYDAWGQLYINKQSPVAAAAEGVSLGGQNFGSAAFVERTLLNDDSLAAVVRQIEPPSQLKSKAQLEMAISRLRSRVSGKPDSGDGFLELHYVDSDPVRAHKVVSLLLNQFIEKNLMRAQADLHRASQFIDEQIEVVGARMLASQDRIAAFRRAHPEVNAVTQPAVEEFIEGAPPPVAVAAAPAAATRSAAAERVAQLEARLATLRMTYTEQYPDVVATRRQLAAAVAERDLEAGLAAAAAAAAPAAPGADPAQPRQAYGSRRRILGPVPPPPLPPAVATEWAELQRSDEVLRLTYQELIAKRAATQMSLAVYGDDASGRFQITREPAVPTIAAGPNRPLYLAAAAFLAVCGGLAAGYLRAGIKGILVSPHELEKAFQLPVIATVSWEPAWHTGRQRALPGRKRPGRRIQAST